MASHHFFQAHDGQDLQSGLSLDSDFSASEADHRISNNLAILASAVSIRATEVAKRQRHLSSEEVSLLLGEISAKVSTIAWLHRFLSQEPAAGRVDINDHLYRLGDTLLSALSDPRRMKLVRTGAGACTVAVGDVVPICLIVTEVITNSLKYAHPTQVSGTIFVGCRAETDGSLVVQVADDGVGLPEGFDVMTDGGTGGRTVRALARQLQAEITFESRPIGLRVTLRVPSRGDRSRAAQPAQA